jgi:hypothetical protein
MNCSRCNTPNEAGVKFCRNCGKDLSVITNQSSNPKTSINVLTAFVGFTVFYTLYYVVIVKYILEPIIKRNTGDFTSMSMVYDISHWVLSTMEFLFILALALIVKQKTAKTLLIIFVVLRFIALILSFVQR